jgi:lipid II:glycine glycyltransferase (peptidoglycan interpeptide bridge formation enzyme)
MGYTNNVLKSYLQTKSWGEFKESLGWLAKTFGSFQGLKRNLPFGQSLWYFPELPWEEFLEKAPKLLVELGSEPTTFSRLEFFVPYTSEGASVLIKLGLIKSFEEVQPEHRQWVSLNQSEEKIFEQMKPKGRYNIRIAQKHNLKVERGTEEALAKRFFPLYQQTATRADFQGRGLGYFLKLVGALAKDGVGEVIIISKDGQDLAGGIFLYYEGFASYLYGGSGGDRSLMAPYLMHWEAIKQAKKRKCAIYDLLAVAPPDTENHPYAGLTRFKTQFGGKTVRMLGSWDLINRPWWYKMYRFAERRRRGKVSQ